MVETKHFNRAADAALMVESVALTQIAADYGTPSFVYSKQAIVEAWQRFKKPLGDHPGLICYAVKANSNIAILQLLASLGAGFDIVSGGELMRVLAAGGDPNKVIFSGVGKTSAEIELALKHQIHCFNVESLAELDKIQQIAEKMDVIAPISFRVNPDVDAKTHPYISTGLKENKFGIPIDSALQAYGAAQKMSHIGITGVDFHIGSQLGEVAPYFEAIDKTLNLIDKLKASGIEVKHLDVGGGMGIQYQDETAMDVQPLFDYLLPKLAERNLAVSMEPGRCIVGNAGALLTKVEYIKDTPDKNFVIVDAAMNDLIRPALYSAWQRVEVVSSAATKTREYDIVGPVCESADFLAKGRELAVDEGDLIAVLDSGAYGFVMSSNYNTRPRAAEILVDNDTTHVVRERESVESLFALEKLV
jgi:diaminopimelate decarboxylase